MSKTSKKVSRLYEEFQPSHYILNLAPDRDAMRFKGTVIISGKKAGRPSQRLTFHQKDIKFTAAHIIKHDKKGDRDIAVERINTHATYDEVRLHTAEMLYPGQYTVSMTFEGDITEQMNGIYPSTFTHHGKQKQLIATQFESHHAREAFPCIDEPEAKATFDLTLTTPLDEPVVANTLPKKQIKKAGKLVTVFETTPKMSTYLLAFAYGEMGYKEASTKSGVQVRTYATPDNVDFTDFALEVAVKCLEFYNDYFALPYPLAKCDFIALPDFASGAMENWGCITFREQCMLVDPENTSLPTKQYVAMVVAHELAHQWFGNLVTMRWWTDLWLNEGFASWIEFLAIDHLFPEWEMWTQFVVDEQQAAMRLDALENTHPVEVQVNHPDEIRTIFDTISYSKGASVIHMLHDYLGAETFRDGLRFYLKKHQHGNTDTKDLWQALEEVSDKPVQSFMHHWTARPGFPILHVTAADKKISFTQERFYVSPEKPETKTEPWPLPLHGNDELFADQLMTLGAWEHPFDGNTSALLFNKGRSGFFHTTYSPGHLQVLGHAVRAGRLEPLDRLGLLSDTFESVKAAYVNTGDALELLENYQDEHNAAVWDVMVSAIGSIRSVMDDNELRDMMKPYMRKLSAKQVKRLGWKHLPDEPHFDSLLRPTVLSLAAVADNKLVVNHALKLFKGIRHPSDLSPDLREGAMYNDVRTGNDVSPDLRGVVYGTAVRYGSTAEFDKLLALHNESNLSEERTTIAAAITGFKQPELVDRALALIDTPTVRLQDVSYWIAYSFMNRYGKQMTWKWLKSHWQWLNDKLGTDLSFYRMPIYAARSFSDESFIEEYEAFFKPKLTPALERPYLQGLEIIRWQAAWKKRDLDTIKSFFKNR